MSPALNFQARFAPIVESGEKRQTIRAYRKDGRDPKVGDTLYLYTGQRTKRCRKLGEARCRSVQPIQIRVGNIALPGKRGGSTSRQCHAIARADGFSDWSAMTRWFSRTHGLPFKGLLIRWGLTDG